MNRRTVLTSSGTLVGSTVTGCLGDRGVMGAPNGSTKPSGNTSDTSMNNPSDRGDSADDETEGSSEIDAGSGNDNGITSTEDSDTSEPTHEDCGSDLEHHFEVRTIEYVGTPTERASVTFEDRTVTVTGAISGSNSCYTARLNRVTIEDHTLVVQVESFEDAGDDEGCRSAIVEIKYRITVKSTNRLPQSVRVEHNSDHVTTEQSP